MENTYVNDYVNLGKGSRIWRFANVYGTLEHPVIIGENTQVGSHCEIKPGVKIGNNCRLQNGVFIPEGVTIEDFVFIGPRVVFTNDRFPEVKKTFSGLWELVETTVCSYSSIGAGVIVLPGAHIATHSCIGAGAVLTKPTKEYGIYVGNPARLVGHVSDDKYRKKYGSM